MGFLAPSALLFGLLAVPIIALYLLRLRGRERRVSSTFLWRQVVQDIEANTLWQSLRPNLLLLLQLLALAALVFALARPYFLRASGIEGDLILVLDASASMMASDVAPSRFREAQQRAVRLIDQLPRGNLVTVIRMGGVPEFLVAQSQDRGRVRGAIAESQPAAGGANLASALSLAASVVREGRPAQVVVLSDGNVTGLQTLGPLPFDLRYEPVGASHSNLAFAAFSIQHTGAGAEGLARVANYGRETRATSLHLYADGSLYDVRDLEVGGNGDQTVRWSSLPEAAVLEARLVPGDTFALDDRAWATGGSGNEARVLLVTRGNRFLDRSLSLQPGLEVTKATPATYSPGGEFDLWVFDGFFPTTLPQRCGIGIGPRRRASPRGCPRRPYLFRQPGPAAAICYVTLTCLMYTFGKRSRFSPRRKRGSSWTLTRDPCSRYGKSPTGGLPPSPSTYTTQTCLFNPPSLSSHKN